MREVKWRDLGNYDNSIRVEHMFFDRILNEQLLSLSFLLLSCLMVRNSLLRWIVWLCTIFILWMVLEPRRFFTTVKAIRWKERRKCGVKVYVLDAEFLFFNWGWGGSGQTALSFSGFSCLCIWHCCGVFTFCKGGMSLCKG